MISKSITYFIAPFRTKFKERNRTKLRGLLRMTRSERDLQAA